MNKEMIKDAVICIILTVVIVFEIVTGFNMLKDKWKLDTSKIISSSTTYGQSLGLVETVFSWPDAPEPEARGDVISIDENRFKINGISSDDSYNTQPGYVYYSTFETNLSRFVQFEEVLDSNKVDLFHNALVDYFSGNASAFLSIMSANMLEENIIAYQQNFTEGAVPVFWDEGTGRYYLLLDCVTSYYVVSSMDPILVTDASATVHYAKASDDPLTSHSWSTYEAGAIDNTRQALMDSEDGEMTAYTQSNVGEVYTDSTGQNYTMESNTQSNTQLYASEADEQARAVLVSYSNKEFDELGNALDGSCKLDISSTTAMRSQWLLTQTQYSFTDNGITINGLSGSRSSSAFEISGNASNTISSRRPWVLCVKFMGENNTLLGVRVVDNRSNPIPADGVSYFTVNLDSSDNIDFSKIVAIQFAVN